MLSRKYTCAFAVTAIVAIVSSTFAGPAYAEENTGSAQASTAIEAIKHVDQTLVSAAAKSSLQTTDKLSYTSAGVTVDIPKNPAEDLTLRNSDGDLLTIGLPFANQASVAVAVESGIPYFDNNNDSATIPIARDDGSVQINTVIRSNKAPHSYVYDFGLPTGASVIAMGESLLFLDKERLVGGLAPAWAKDATGRDVPTHYEVSGATITQVVDHTDEFSYPIVADPWLGVNLFSSVKRVNYASYYKISAALSFWGRTIHTSGYAGTSGLRIFITAGWGEIISRQSSANTKTILQQYGCHVIGGLFEWDTWDFESNRRVNNDYAQWVSSRCNW